MQECLDQGLSETTYVFEDLTFDLERSNNALIAIISKTMTDTDLVCIIHI